MKYKVGDKVKIRSLEWYNENKDEDGEVFVGNQSFVEDMKEYCGKEAIITGTFINGYFINIDRQCWYWTDEMFEEPSNCAMGINKPSYKLNVKTDMEQKKEFKPFERVIIRRKDNVNGAVRLWTCAEFSHYNGNFIALVGCYEYDKTMFDVLPFAGNEHLVGTSDMPDEEVQLKPLDFIFVFDKLEHKGELSSLVLGRFVCLNGDKIDISDDMSHHWTYCIPFSKFSPNDMEETKKHILCVKNGKLVKERV